MDSSDVVQRHMLWLLLQLVTDALEGASLPSSFLTMQSLLLLQQGIRPERQAPVSLLQESVPLVSSELALLVPFPGRHEDQEQLQRQASCGWMYLQVGVSHRESRSRETDGSSLS